MYLVFVVLFLVFLYGPQWWARHTLLQYNRQDYFSGTGLEFARLLVAHLSLQGVRVIEDPLSSHYNPENRTVSIEARFAGRKTLAAVVVAAHEVSHAIQHAHEEVAFQARMRLVQWAQSLERVGYLVFIVLPLMTALFRLPALAGLTIVAAVAILITPLAVHLITLPVEWDASFNKALPLLISGPFIPEEDLPSARQILLACSLTYVAAALAGFFNVWRWLKVLKR